MDMVLAVIVIIGVVVLIAVIFYSVFAGTASVQQQCSNNNDCPTGTVCDNGICISKPQCTQDNDCNNEQTCVGGRCVTNNCNNDNQCGLGQVCVSGQCFSQTCRADDECPKASYCVGGRCQPMKCTATCPTGSGCYQGQCYPVNTSCNTNKDCFDNSLTCNNGFCTPPPPVACPLGWLIKDGFCYPQTDATCPIGNKAVNGICCPNDYFNSRVCFSNSECGDNNPYCVNYRCTCDTANVPQIYPSYPYAVCTENSQCGSGKCMKLERLRGFCVPDSYTCISNLQCASGFYCKNGLCTAGNAEGSYCIDEQTTCRETGRSCVNNICTTIPGGLGDLCYNITDCQPGLTCNNLGKCSLSL